MIALPVTYEPIATTTVTSVTVADVTFSSISGSFTDLILVSNYASAGNAALVCQVNADTATNYSRTTLFGSGSAVSSGRVSNDSFMNIGGAGAGSTIGETISIAHFMNYSNTTTNKTVLSRGGRASASPSFPGTGAEVNLWRSTAAITSIKIYMASGSISQNSIFTLYGIKAA